MDHAKYHAKPLLNTPVVLTPDTTIEIDGQASPPRPASRSSKPSIALWRLSSKPSRRSATSSPWATSAPATPAWSSSDGKLVRACEARVAPGQIVYTRSDRADVAQRDAFDRILHNHDLYCTVCDNNNQNCTVHNTTKELAVKHQVRKFEHKPYQQDHSNPFYRYDPDQCILCGRCVEACQNVQVNETLTIDWTREHPARALGWRRADRRLLLRLLRPLRHRLPLQRAHGKRHARPAPATSPSLPPRSSTT